MTLRTSSELCSECPSPSALRTAFPLVGEPRTLLPQSKVSSLYLLLAVVLFMGCSGQDSDRPGSLEAIAELPGLATGPCDEGAEQACSTTVEQESGVVSCFVGWQGCERGRWGACENLELTTQADLVVEEIGARD